MSLFYFNELDAAFIHEGNDTFVSDSLVNFEKMVSICVYCHAFGGFRDQLYL